MTTGEQAIQYVDVVEPCFISLYLCCDQKHYGCNKDLLGVKSKFIKQIFFGQDGVDQTLLSPSVNGKPCITIPDRFQYIIRQVLDHLSNSTIVHFDQLSVHYYQRWTHCFELLAFLQVEKFNMPDLGATFTSYSFDKMKFDTVLQLIDTAYRLGYKNAAFSIYAEVLLSLDRICLKFAFYSVQKILERLPVEFHTIALSFEKK